MVRLRLLTLSIFLGFTPVVLAGQTPAGHPPASGATHALALAQSGHCPQALPMLQKAYGEHLNAKRRLQVGLQALSCAMSMNQPETGLRLLLPLQQDFPHDPEVLYMATHVYSDLSMKASRSLIFFAPNSYQVHELNAESLEVQGEWQKAEGEYRIVLQKDPGLPGIHYRIGRLLLSEPPAADPAEQQKRLQAAAAEFEDELKIDPHNAGAEFVLGELARQAAHWSDAIEHFSQATKLDPRFTDAFIALGEAQISAKDFSSAVAPLQTAEKQQPGNPTPHFLLARAYQQSGQAEQARHEEDLYQQARQEAQAVKNRLQKQLMQGEEALQPQR